MDSVCAKNTIIRYDEKNPRIEIMGEKYVDEEKAEECRAPHRSDGTFGVKKTIIYCPEGSINSDFDLDMKS